MILPIVTSYNRFYYSPQNTIVDFKDTQVKQKKQIDEIIRAADVEITNDGNIGNNTGKGSFY